MEKKYLFIWTPHSTITYPYFYECVQCRARLLLMAWLVTLWTVVCQAPLSMGFSKQKYWSGLPCAPPGDHPNPGIESTSPGLSDVFFTTSVTVEALSWMYLLQKKSHVISAMETNRQVRGSTAQCEEEECIQLISTLQSASYSEISFHSVRQSGQPPRTRLNFYPWV